MSPLAALLLFVIPLVAEAVSTDAPTAYQILRYYGLPVGLLPKGVTTYKLEADTGKFAVNLNGTCTFTVAGYDIKFSSKISGTISNRKTTNLNGIHVKVLFFWVNTIEVSADGNNLEFSVGIASADFPVNGFHESPQCGCGFDCVNRIGRLPPPIDI